jgi:hypothetical protein
MSKSLSVGGAQGLNLQGGLASEFFFFPRLHCFSPQFVLVATTSNPARIVSKSLGNDQQAVHKAQAWRVPIFRFASVQR